MSERRSLTSSDPCGGSEWWGHVLAWLGGALLVLTPFVRDWSLTWGEWSFPARVWPGNFFICLVVGVFLAVLGAVAGGTWWLVAGRMALRRRFGIAALAAGIGGLGCVGGIPKLPFGCVMLLLAVGWVITVRAGRRGLGAGDRMPARDPVMPWNALLFILLIALALAGDCIVLAKHGATGTAVFAFVITRLLTHLTLVALAWWLLHLLKARSPRGLRWSADLVACGALVCLLAEVGMNRLWGKSLAIFFSEFAVGGKFDLAALMEGGNVEIGIAGAFAIAGVVLAILGLCGLLQWLSRLLGCRVRASRLLLLAVVGWLALVAEQASERLWNERAGRWLQRRSLLVHLSPFAAKPGLASFRTDFKEFPRPTGEGATRKPDVFLFIVETLRRDAIRPEITPFLDRWQREECQETRHSRSASNGTHLSWFTILGGSPSLLWDRGRELVRPAPMQEILKSLGYRTEVRSAAAFDYMQMDTTNFGRGESTDFMMNRRVEPSTWPRGASACDLHVLSQWQQSLPSLPPGPVFQITDIESPHYPYYWIESDRFKVPHADYYQSLNFPFMPGRESVRLIRNRYGNSVAFVDHLLDTYISELKRAGRYEESMIIVTGDHGDELQENGFWFHCTALTPQQTAVPVFIKWPRSMGRGRAVPEVSHMDILPSVMQALGCPPAQWSGLAGRALHQGGEATTLLTSYYASQNGEGMVWRRGGYEAAFGWNQIWVQRRPSTVWLERLTGPDGPVHLRNAAAAAAALREHFPDAEARWFERFELLGE